MSVIFLGIAAFWSWAYWPYELAELNGGLDHIPIKDQIDIAQPSQAMTFLWLKTNDYPKGLDVPTLKRRAEWEGEVVEQWRFQDFSGNHAIVNFHAPISEEVPQSPWEEVDERRVRSVLNLMDVGDDYIDIARFCADYGGATDFLRAASHLETDTLRARMLPAPRWSRDEIVLGCILWRYHGALIPAHIKRPGLDWYVYGDGPGLWYLIVRKADTKFMASVSMACENLDLGAAIAGWIVNYGYIP